MKTYTWDEITNSYEAWDDSCEGIIATGRYLLKEHYSTYDPHEMPMAIQVFETKDAFAMIGNKFYKITGKVNLEEIDNTINQHLIELAS